MGIITTWRQGSDAKREALALANRDATMAQHPALASSRCMAFGAYVSALNSNMLIVVDEYGTYYRIDRRPPLPGFERGWRRLVDRFMWWKQARPLSGKHIEVVADIDAGECIAVGVDVHVYGSWTALPS